jgi:glycine/D-amino acid oxidase-like deaminating enzyme
MPMPMPMPMPMRIVVLGAGIVGVHVAAELARRGADVTLIEAGEPGGGTTAGSLAWIDASAPGIADYLELRLLGVRAWRRQAEEPWLSLPGTIGWTRDASEHAAHVERLEQFGERVERLDVAAALRHQPDLVIPGDVRTVYRFPGEGWLHAAPAIDALLERGRAAGLRLQTGTPAQPHEHEDVVVSCVGRWTGSLLPFTVPMLESDQPGVAGFVARTRPLAARIRSVIAADGLLIRPETGGRVLLHSGACDAELGDPAAASNRLLEMLRERVRGTQRASIEDAWVCLRAIPADRLPVVGWARDGLYVVATHSGVTLAPALADLVASEVIDGADRSELKRFRPDRFRRAGP